MAAQANSGVNNTGQVSISGGYLSDAYQSYCAKLTAVSSLPANAKGDEVIEAQRAADDLLSNMLSARAASLSELLLKVKAAKHGAKDTAHATDDPETFNTLSWVADDLDCILAAGDRSEDDPAVASYHTFTAAHDALDVGPDDNQGELTKAAAHAYRALLAAVPTTAAGASLQIKGHLRWTGTPDDEDHEALCRISEVLERLTAGGR